MNINDWKNILHKENIEILIQDGVIKEVVGQDQDAYGIEKVDNTYNYIYISHERKTYPEKKILKTFKDEKLAFNFFVFSLLSNMYLDKYNDITKKYGSRILSMEKMKFDDIVTILRENGYESKYICIGKNLKKNSMFLYEEHDGWYTSYLDENMKVAFGSKVPSNITLIILTAIQDDIMLCCLEDFIHKYSLENEVGILEKEMLLGYYNPKEI